MPAASNPLTQTGEPITWNFKLLAQNNLGGFGGMGEGMAVQDRQGRPPHHLAGARKRAEEFHRRRRVRSAQPKVVVQTDLPQAICARIRWNARQQHPGGRLSDAEEGPAAGRRRTVRCVGAGEAALDLVLRLLGRDLARRASIVVLRRRIHPHGLGRRRLQAEQSARRPVLPLHRRTQSVEADGSRPLVDAGHARGRQRRAAAAPQARQGLSRAQHQCLQAAAGPALSRLYRRRHVRDGHFRQGAIRSRSRTGPIRRPIPASCTR